MPLMSFSWKTHQSALELKLDLYPSIYIKCWLNSSVKKTKRYRQNMSQTCKNILQVWKSLGKTSDI